MNALAELERIRGEVGAQRARVADLDRARHDGPRKLQLANDALAEFVREREFGALDGDLDAQEAELVRAVDEAEKGLDVRAVSKPFGGDKAPEVSIEHVDLLAEKRYESAQKALEAAVDRLAEFASAHMDDLQAERAALAAAARAALIDADRVYRLATEGVQVELNWQTQLGNDARMPGLIGDLPKNPGAWIGQAPSPSSASAWGAKDPTPGKVALPMPEAYWP